MELRGLEADVEARIDRAAEVADFEVEVMAGGVAGEAGETKDRARAYRLARADVDLAHVGVERGPAFATIDDDVVAVAIGQILDVVTTPSQTEKSGDGP